MKNSTFYTFLVLAVLFLGGIVTAIVMAKSSSTPSNGGSAPVAGAAQYSVQAAAEPVVVQLNGKWLAKENDLVFQAEVKNGGITIELVGSEGTTMDYWVGTFKSSETVGQSINSVVDTNKFVLSQDPNKSFTVGDDTLSFKFSAMGVSKTVVLHRG